MTNMYNDLVVGMKIRFNIELNFWINSETVWSSEWILRLLIHYWLIFKLSQLNLLTINCKSWKPIKFTCNKLWDKATN